MDLRLTRNIILYLLLAGIMVFVNVSCKVTKINAPKDETIRKAVRTNQVFQSAFTGFVLYDPLRQSSLIEINSNKPFIPASNTKIVTLLNTLETLGDSLPIISYLQSNDTLYFRGTANPLNLNPNFQDNGHWLQWCDDMRDKTLVYVREYPTPKKFGPGWAWDDYLYNYQLEKDPMLLESAIHFFELD